MIFRMYVKDDSSSSGAYCFASAIGLDTAHPRRLSCKVGHVVLGGEEDRSVAKLVESVQVVECQMRTFIDSSEIDSGDRVNQLLANVGGEEDLALVQRNEWSYGSQNVSVSYIPVVNKKAGVKKVCSHQNREQKPVLWVCRGAHGETRHLLYQLRELCRSKHISLAF